MRRLFFLLLLSFSCSNGGGVNSTEQAKQAYLGLDESIDKAITLGFAGFNAASSANIPTEKTNGDGNGKKVPHIAVKPAN